MIFQDGGGQVPLAPLLPSSTPAAPSVLAETVTPSSSWITTTSTPYLVPEPVHEPDTSYTRHALDEAARIDSFINPILSSHDIYTAELNRLSSDTAALAIDNSTDPMLRGRKCLPLTIASTIVNFFTISFVLQHFGPSIAPPSEKLEEPAWIASSPSWLERKVCSWFGLCGLAHLDTSNWTQPKSLTDERDQEVSEDESPLNFTWTDSESFWSSGLEDSDSWSEQERILREIPDYVYEYAPLVHLFSGEHFWPCDIAEHLLHITPHLNYTQLKSESDHPNLTQLNDLNKWGRSVFLKSDDNVEERPDWLGGSSNIPGDPEEPDLIASHDTEDWDIPQHMSQEEWQRQPWFNVGPGDAKERGGDRHSETNRPISEGVDEKEQTYESESQRQNRRRHRSHPREFPNGALPQNPPQQGGRSDAPAVLVVVDKGNGVVDAFWFWFYSYNQGNTVFGVRFGNHVGDWEHSVVRFHHGRPKVVYFSEHNFGKAYAYQAVEKAGKRPIVYSATGSHAMYATPGVHPYVLPWGLLHDVTDRGPLWDPVLNNHAFTYNATSDTLRASTLSPHAPIGWFYFKGHWGDKHYPLSDPRQYRFAGQYHYVNGPLGPRFKNLGRKKICQGNGDCEIKESRFDILNEGGKGERGVRRTWDDPRGRGDEISDLEARTFH